MVKAVLGVPWDNARNVEKRHGYAEKGISGRRNGNCPQVLSFGNWEKELEKIFFGKPLERTLLALTLENSVLKSDKKTNIIFWERRKSLFFFVE